MTIEISVVLPVYNGAAYLKETLDSIAIQSYKDFELVIVDDGSSDDSLHILKSWMEEHADIKTKLIAHHTNHGVCHSLKTAIKNSNGNFIAQIGHDDVWEKEHLFAMHTSLDDDAVAVFSDISYIDGSSREIQCKIFKHHLISELDRYKLFALLIQGNFLCAPASMFRRDCFTEEMMGVNNERLQDYELWLNLLCLGEFRRTEFCTVKYRQHSRNLSREGTMAIQSRYELYSSQQRATASKGFELFISFAIEKQVLAEFLADLTNAFIAVSEFHPPQKLIYMTVLESLFEKFSGNQDVAAERARLFCRLGMYRKSLSLSKLLPYSKQTSYEGAPLVVPIGNQRSLALENILFSSPLLRNGAEVDLVGNGITNFYFLVNASELEQLRSYDIVAAAINERRLIAFGNDVQASTQYICQITSSVVDVSYQTIDKILRYIEDRA
ncbi:putative glycosyltransferase (family GT2) (plasmid) [Methylorubrum extorquens DM4]|uniref:Glycosyltransferase (Family GT2) n=1 Tax=Methylorubrum extorquens (strain DSM 6343 / CIP 106787 / DM4) TaxID=661410 RepID=A0A2P9HAZ3_METED|nr:glycosyltransferase [Methylorubrum extorquens]SPK02053.1 putative glycosyltransferase (family GT2) [Methylorubrum extorquens DM4]